MKLKWINSVLGYFVPETVDSITNWLTSLNMLRSPTYLDKLIYDIKLPKPANKRLISKTENSTRFGISRSQSFSTA